MNGIPHSTYQLDNLSPTDYVAPFSLGGIVNHTFYSSPDLANDQHTLVVILSSHPAVLWLDYLTYTTSNNSTSSSPSLGPPSTNSQQSSSSTYDPSSTLPILSSSTVSSPSTTGSSSTATQPSDPQANTTSSRETTVGKVVCIICGVLFAIGAVTVGVVIWKSRRARRAREGQLSPITTQGKSTVSFSFIVDTHIKCTDIGRPLRGAFPSTPYTSSSFLQYPRSLASSPTVYHHTPHYSMSATGRIPQTTTPFRRSFTDLPHLPWRSSSPRIHSDAGVRLNGEHLEGKVVDYGGDSLPPPYVDRRARNVHHPLLQVSSRSSISRTM